VIAEKDKYMKVTNAPTWAVNLTEEVCKDYKRALPVKLQWHNSKIHKMSSGHATYYRLSGARMMIHVTAGSDIVYQRLVLLHELAHHITNKRKRCGHNAKFWHLAFELYDRYGVGIEVAHKREKNYKKYATVAYQRILAKK
jgi:Zn-dependent peptidase ImmA (M78 family)